MLLSELKERERRFVVALRAAIPVLLLSVLIFYATFGKYLKRDIDTYTIFMMLAVVFVAVYFNYFLIEQSIKESMVDQSTMSFNHKSFIKKIKNYKPSTLMILNITNLQTINFFNPSELVDKMLFDLIHKLHIHLENDGFKAPLIGREYGAKFIIALKTNNTEQTQKSMDDFIRENSTIDGMDVEFKYAAVTDAKQNIEKMLKQLQDLLASQTYYKTTSRIKEARELDENEMAVVDALKREAIDLSFRPLLNVKKDKVDMYEVSAKFISNSGKEILPKVFLPIINRLGLGIEYDKLLSKEIISILDLVDDDISFTFNLSPFSLRNTSFESSFFEMLSNDKNPSRLTIQLYEKNTHHNISRYLEVLEKFRLNGVKVCIDNFGSSNASLEYMQHFRFDMVQFDRSFTTKLHDQTTNAMLASLIEMSKKLSITTVAKWVDNEEQKRQLLNMDIDYMQGFGIKKPLNRDKLIRRYN